MAMLAALVMMVGAAPAAAQTGETSGPWANRVYESYEPFEVHDTSSGQLGLLFTDLVLPGHGWTLAFQRRFDARTGVWTFGIAGLPLRYTGSLGQVHTFYTVNGPVTDPIIVAGTSPYIRMTDRFWRFHENTRELGLPDGTRAVYDSSRRLSQVFDAANRPLLSLVWQTSPSHLTVTQHLGNGQQRSIVVWGATTLGLPGQLPTMMNYQGRVWNYAWNTIMTDITLPGGAKWEFDWTRVGGYVDWLRVITPHGGWIEYTFTLEDLTETTFNTLTTRQVRDEQQQPVGTWTYQYDFTPAAPYFSAETTVVGPTVAGQTATITYTYEQLTGPIAVPAREIALTGRTVTAGGPVLEQETLGYTLVPIPSMSGTDQLPALAARTLTRDGVTSTTTLTYNAWYYGDFHHPATIVETSGGVSRTTTRVYDHTYVHIGPGAWPYIIGMPLSQSVTIAGDTTTASWTYDMNTGFRTSETVNGLTTTFTPDTNLGSVAVVTRPNGKTTSFTYSWGQVSGIQTSEPGYAITRVVNADGTIASETQAGRTTSYSYDSLMRLTGIQGPGGLTVSVPVVIAYDNAAGRTITTTRGSSSLVETLDGFGRVREAVDSLGIRTRTTYDALGRVVYVSYPFKPGVGQGDIGTTVTWDPLNRVTRKTHPDGTFVEYVYAGSTVTVRDELHPVQGPRQTIYTYQPFGHPDDARLVQLHDANNQVWSYAYTVEGAIKTLSGPNSVVRTWNYSHPNRLLASETHPESGTVTYTYQQGVLTQRVDAKGTTFAYTRDGNDRVRQITAGGQVTTFTYEDGSDVLETMAVGTVQTTFDIDDTSGRLASRTDVVDGKTFVTSYEYDTRDALQAITYPSGQRVLFDHDAELRLTRVYSDSGADYATGFTYHPSGALTGYTAGNGVPTVLEYDDQRYWVDTIRVGPEPQPLFELGYSHLPTGNVEAMADVHAGASQIFGYDTLHRLTSVTGTGGYPSASFTFDAHGNRTGGGFSYYSNNRFRLKSLNGFGDLVYDTNGNLTHHSGGVFAYTYGPDNRMTRTTAGGVTTDFAYAADAWRVKSAVQGGTTTYFVRGPGGELLTEWINTSPTATVRDFIYAGGRLVAIATLSAAPK